MVGFDAYAKIILQIVLEERIRSFLLQYYPFGYIKLYYNYKSSDKTHLPSLIDEWFDGTIHPDPKQQAKLNKKLKKLLEDKTLHKQLPNTSAATVASAFGAPGTEGRENSRKQIVASLQSAVDSTKIEKDKYHRTFAVWDKFWGGMGDDQIVPFGSGKYLEAFIPRPQGSQDFFMMDNSSLPGPKTIALGEHSDTITGIRGDYILVHFFAKSLDFYKATDEYGEGGTTGTYAKAKSLMPSIPNLPGLLTYLPAGGSALIDKGDKYGVGKNGEDPIFTDDPNWALKRCGVTWLFWHLPVDYIPDTGPGGALIDEDYNWWSAQDNAGFDKPNKSRTMRDVVLKELTGANHVEINKRINWWYNKCRTTHTYYETRESQEKTLWNKHKDWLKIMSAELGIEADIGGFIDFLGDERSNHRSKIQKLYLFAALALDDSAESKKKWEEIKENIICQNEIKEKKEREKEELERSGNMAAAKAKQKEIDQIQDEIDDIEKGSTELGDSAMKKIFEKFILKTVKDITNYVDTKGADINIEDVMTAAAKSGKTFLKGDIEDLLGTAGTEVVSELRNYNQILESMIFNVIDLLEA